MPERGRRRKSEKLSGHSQRMGWGGGETAKVLEEEKENRPLSGTGEKGHKTYRVSNDGKVSGGGRKEE